MEIFSGIWEALLEYPVVTRVAIAGLIIGGLLGFIMNRANFCTMGALSDINAFGDWKRFRTWTLAMAVAIIATQLLAFGGYLDMSKSIYLGATFNWVAFLVGGFIFGVGMVYGSGCGAKNLIRLGGGDLKGLVVVLVIGIVSYMTLRGLLAPVRVGLNGIAPLGLEGLGLADTGLHTIIAKLTGASSSVALGVASGLAALGLLVFTFKDAGYRRARGHVFAGVSIGLLVAGGWWATGVLGFDDFEPTQLFSLTFISPTGNTVQYLMTFTGATISFGIASVFGMILGSFLASVVSGSFAIGGFADKNDLIRHLVGGSLMGFGAVTSLGCTVGQGITGISTLALSSLVALLAIIAGGFTGFKLMERGVLV